MILSDVLVRKLPKSENYSHKSKKRLQSVPLSCYYLSDLNFKIFLTYVEKRLDSKPES